MAILHPPFRDLAVASVVVLGGLALTTVLRLRRSRLYLPTALLTVFCVLAAVGALYPRSQVFGYALWRGSRVAPSVALTFDDGPSSRYTPEILDALAKEHAKATFFMVGRDVLANAEVARRVAREGHAIGDHTFTHPDLIVTTPGRIHSEIERTQRAIARATGVTPALFRPPYGFRTPLVYRQLKRSDLRLVEWTVSSQDWRRLGPKRVARQVLRRVRHGSIVLFHDGRGNRSDTVASLPIVLKGMKRRGYRFVTVPELLAEQNQHP